MRQKNIGLLFIAAAFFLAAISSLVVVSLTSSMAEFATVTRFTANQAAFHLAEAAVDAAIGNLRGGQFHDLAMSPMPRGSYWAEVKPVGTLQFLVTGHGLYGAEQRDVEAVVQLTPRSVFQFALFGSQQVLVSGSAVTDSFNSSLGAYNSAMPGQNGDVGTNASSLGGVTISGSIAINGRVVVGPNVQDPVSVVKIEGGPVLVTQYPPVVSQPVALAMPAVSAPAGMSCTDQSVGGQNVLALSSAVGMYCFVNLSVSGGGTVTVDGPLTVYVTGQFSAGGDTLIGSPAAPRNLLVILTSAQTGSFGSLSGTTVFGGAIYAPNGSINVSGNAEVFGSVVARTINISSNARLHYDEAVGDLATPVGFYDTQLLSWRDR